MSETKYINVKEFREKGYLQELNRQFLHPLGMALEVQIDRNGNEQLGGIWDYRDDPEGILYSDSTVESNRFKEHIEFVHKQWKEKEEVRKQKFDFMIQE